jgi:GntR family transcriptional regulator
MLRKRLLTQHLYLQLRDVLAARIARGEWKPGSPIPSEEDIAREFGVSKGTTRKSLDLLESERLVVRRPGRGTFVVDPGSQRASQRFNNFRLADGTSFEGEVVTLGMVTAEASVSECARLQLTKGNEVYRIRRIRSHQRRAFMVEDASLPVALFPQLMEKALRSHRIVDIAQAYSVLLGNSEERLFARPCSPSAAEVLKIGVGTLVLMVDRLIRTRDGRLAEWRRGECVLDGMHYHLNFD